MRHLPGRLLLLLGAFLLPILHAQGQSRDPLYVDRNGVMRWTGTDQEVALFGVNYTTPFAYAHRAVERLGLSHKEAIDRDVSHFARLRLDAYRIHVWDREVSDRQGNLVANEHLDLLDYLLWRLKERGIKVILTPIAWWQTGYPESSPKTEGFSEDFSKGDLTTRPEARPIQQNYLRQFMRHVNPYTKMAYGDDPNIVAIEIFNEPNHPGKPSETTAYIDAMAGAIRETGYRRPIFYNATMGGSEVYARAVCSAAIQGISFQWYPSGLVRGSTVGANMLPNVDEYPFPYGEVQECRDKSRMIYEFDAADVAGSYMYPAMARSFRGAGMQWATQFAYDPLAIAYSNTEYQTHYLNLVYTPGKAISLMIAAEAFRQTPRGASYGTYPQSSRFGPFRVSYEENLSEMAADTTFYYSNNTRTEPPDIRALRHVAGYGTSPIIAYGGRGAYFLDRLEPGVWRLEVYPDAVAIDDWFARPSLKRTTSRIIWRDRPMHVSLPDLGNDFSVRAVNAGNQHQPAVQNGSFPVRPGVYVLRRRGIVGDRWTDPVTRIGSRHLGEFFAPRDAQVPLQVIHQPPFDATAGHIVSVRAEVVAPVAPDSVTLWPVRSGPGRLARIAMRSTDGYTFQADITPENVREGLLEYYIVVHAGGRTKTYPGGMESAPAQWDFTGRETYRIPVVTNATPIVLFDAARDRDRMLMPHIWRYVRFTSSYGSGQLPGELALRVNIENLQPEPKSFAFRTFLGEDRATRLQNEDRFDALLVRARATGKTPEQLEVALVELDGTARGATIRVDTTWSEYTIPLRDLRRVPLALLPSPYPEFLPYYLETKGSTEKPELRQLEGIQVALKAASYEPSAVGQPHGFEIDRILLGRERPKSTR